MDNYLLISPEGEEYLYELFGFKEFFFFWYNNRAIVFKVFILHRIKEDTH